MNVTQIAVAFALLLITGCTHDREQPLEQRATLSLKVASGSFATTNTDDQMDPVRIVDFKAADVYPKDVSARSFGYVIRCVKANTRQQYKQRL